MEDQAQKSDTPESLLRQKEASMGFSKSLAKLTEKNRLVFTLHTLEGLSYRQIAQTLGISEGTVASRLYAARKTLIAAMEKGSSPI